MHFRPSIQLFFLTWMTHINAGPISILLHLKQQFSASEACFSINGAKEDEKWWGAEGMGVFLSRCLYHLWMFATVKSHQAGCDLNLECCLHWEGKWLESKWQVWNESVVFFARERDKKMTRNRNLRNFEFMTPLTALFFFPPGVRHSNIICDSCKKHGIMGMRWKCKVCFDYDLCTQCYMNNKHDLSHAFERYETAHSQPWVPLCQLTSTIDHHLYYNYIAVCHCALTVCVLLKSNLTHGRKGLISVLSSSLLVRLMLNTQTTRFSQSSCHFSF